ncbi:lysophospholipase [Roseiconus lacunae]|uniref:alpha/beta hydrolase n=1 Tax=Roseiconus lacunae TaxID=2605694 RepID=UPI003093A8C3|nr:lysophospholipase [Stieleria sp. HD01]
MFAVQSVDVGLDSAFLWQVLSNDGNVMLVPRQIRLGSLDSFCLEPTGDSPPEAVVVLCHGYGAPGSDMVGVVQDWASLLGGQASRYQFLCPLAPLSLAELGMPGGRAWWSLNMARMMEAVQAQRFEELHAETPPGLDAARTQLGELIQTALERMADKTGQKIDDIPLAIGGFSQGAMLTMDTALQGPCRAPNLLFQFSGTVICQPQWNVQMSRLSHTRVYQSHGTVDPILPFASAERLRDMLISAEVDLKFHQFYGPHTIDGDSIQTTATMLKELTR